MPKNDNRRIVSVYIQRFNPDIDQEPYINEYQVELTQGMTILDALHAIKTEQDGSLTFRRSCRHGICGSCAMNVNGKNILACENPLKDNLDGEDRITILPLPYLPVIKDLVVDRSIFWDQYQRIKPWLIPADELPVRETRISPEEVKNLNNAERCIMCGACYSACPVISLDDGFLGPHAMLKAFLRVSDPRTSIVAEHMADSATVWDCTTCYMCDSLCPKEIDPGQAARTLRSLLVEDGQVPRNTGRALTSTFRQNNPFEMAHADRNKWMEGLPLVDGLQEAVDALYFVCCIACYDPRAQKSAQAMVKVMDAAGIKLGTLGSKEACCGSEVRRMGEFGLYEMMSEERTKTLQAIKTEQIVTTSPHCFDVFKNHYPGLNTSSEHYTEFVARLISDGQVTFNKKVEKVVTYHDPCYLGIQNNIFDQPRAILQSIPGVELIEMERNREKSFCCGGGGGRMWFEGHLSGAHLSHERIHQAVATGAQILATACPFCLNMLDDAIKTMGLDDQIEVQDIMELVSEAI